MARRQRDRLSVKFIESATRGKSPKPGMHADGLGLYLSVSKSGAASWLFRYKLEKKPHYLGLGSLDDVSLAEARERATAARRKAHDGIDPIEQKRAERLTAKLDSAKAMTFRQCAEAYIEDHRAGWTNPRHAKEWPSSLERHAYPIIGDLPVSEIDRQLVLKVIKPMWSTKTETASRVRGRIESVLAWATVNDYRQGDNPASWKGHLDAALPDRAKVAPVKHMAALPYAKIAEFMVKLREDQSVARPLLEFMILTATRRNEARLARWSEIDLDKRLWTIPAERVKVRKEHRVPLSESAITILHRMAEVRQNDLVFPGFQGGAIADNGLTILAQKLAGVTAHGFRSTFRDWAAERSNVPHEVAEMALGHTVGAAVERAYRRGDLFEKRRQVAEAWARYCAAPQAEGRVVPIRGAAK